MRLLLTLLFALAWAPTFADGAPPVETGAILARTYDFKEAGKPMEYALYVPTHYNKKKPAPLVILLHGLGSNPQQITSGP